MLACLSGGHDTAAASGAWALTVLHFANAEPDPDTLFTGIRTANHFDPEFQAPYVNGSLMLRRSGGADSTPAVLDAAMIAFPDEPWFPWARGMHAWMDGDHDAAAAWLDRANRLAPSDVHQRAVDALEAHP